MDEMDHKQKPANVNVTLSPSKPRSEDWEGKTTPCPLCGAGLPILTSKRRKPYCVCNLCGMQLFVRGKQGISRLRKIAKYGIPIAAGEESVFHALSLLNRLEQLKLQRNDLAEKSGFLFPDANITNAIEIIDVEMEKVQSELAKAAREKRKENKS